jgi:hypothetical protein
MDRPVKTHIPSSAAPFFQEYRIANLDIQQHAALIMERILAYGNRAEVQWLLATYGRQAVREWVAQAGQRRLSWRRFHLWCLVFDIPIPQKPHRIWPY